MKKPAMAYIEVRDAGGDTVRASRPVAELTDEQRDALADAACAVLRFLGVAAAGRVGG